MSAFNQQTPPSPQPPASISPVSKQPPPFSKPWLRWILLIIVAVLLSSGGTYLVLTQQKIEQPQPSPSLTASPVPTDAGETANWKTYTNTDYGYSVKYPPVWSNITCGSAVLFDKEPFFSCATDVSGIFSISVRNKTSETPLINTGKEFKVISANLVNIGGKQGERMVTEKVEPAPGADKIIIAAVEYKGKVYTLNLQDINEQVVFDQILQTIKFLQ